MKEGINFKRVSLFFVLASLGLGVWAYGELPESVASHWNGSGEADGYMSKFWGAFLFPLITILVYLLYLLIPKIAIRKKNLEAFIRNFDRFFMVMLAFTIYMFGMTLWWNINGEFNFNRYLSIGFVPLVWEVGILVGSAKRNWFVGIRTPWTLSSDRVWKATHQLAAKLFKIATVVALLGVFFSDYTLWFLLTSLLGASLIPVVFSYFAYKQLDK